MRKPKRRWPASALFSLISLGFGAAGCAGSRPPCVALIESDIVTVAQSVPPPLHWAVTGTLRRGLLTLDFDADILFVPPDTCRMIGRTAWGETLFDFKAFGDSMSLFRQDREAVSRALLPVAVRQGLRIVFYAAGGNYPPLNPLHFETECTREGLLVITETLHILLDPIDHRLRKIDLTFPSASMVVGEYEKGGGPPGRYQFNYQDELTLDIRIKKRFFKAPLSGFAILN